MFQIGDIIIYGSQGVCTVEKIGQLDISPKIKDKLYYTLKPLYHHDTVFYVPVEFEKSVLRAIISTEEAKQLISEIKDIPTVWIQSEKEREQQYKQALRTCDCKELVRVIKTLYERKKSRIKDGKKVTALDEKYFRQAEEQLYGELSVVLGIEKSKVAEYITNENQG